MAYLTLQTQTIDDWRYGGSTAYLYIWSSQQFFEATTGEMIAQGQVNDLLSFCQKVTCTVSGTTLTIPTVTLASTTDSTVPNATYTAILATSSNRLVYPILSQFSVDPEYLESSVQSAVEIASAGTTAQNGQYTHRGETGGYNYYNLLGQASSTSNWCIKNDGSQWVNTNAVGTTMYTTVTQEDTPWDGAWIEASGASPAPTVSEDTQYISGTWEQLILSNQGVSSIPPQWPGPFWNVPQIKEYVNNLVGDGTTPFASATVAGKTELDVDPDLASTPIAVGVNSPRVSKVLSVDYANSLATAISSIGATATLLLVTEDSDVATSVVVPATLTLSFRNGATLNKTSSGAIEFEGLGIDAPVSQTAIFSAFAAGDITWSGTHPSSISTELWDTSNTSLTQRLDRANAAFTDQVTIVCYPRTITGTATFSQYRDIYFTAGDYPNTIGTNIYPFIFTDDFSASAAPGARIYVSNTGGAGFKPTSLTAVINNVFFEDLYMIADVAAVGDPANSIIITGNVHIGHIKGCVFENTKQYVAIGGSGASSNYAENVAAFDNQFINTPTQILAVINGKNIQLYDNHFDVRDIATSANGTLIDIEPNDADDLVENLLIHSNTFDMRSSGVLYMNAITVQGGYNGISNVVISDNVAIGDDVGTFLIGIACYGVDGLRVSNNNLVYASAQPYLFYNCHNVLCEDNESHNGGDSSGNLSAIRLTGINDAQCISNTLSRAAAAGRATGIYEAELSFTSTTATGSTVTLAHPNFAYEWWEGLTIKLAGTPYVVDQVTAPDTFTTTAPTGVFSGTLTSVFSNNTYKDNDASLITLSSDGSSRILGDYIRSVTDSYAPAQVTSNQDNYNPGVNAVRFDISTDASRNITGLVFTSPSQIDGEHHEIYNAGSFNIVLVHNATSTAANRFWTNTLADITLLPGQRATLEYNSTISRWLVAAYDVIITASSLPSAIDATKIADGSVSNTEFQYLNGVSSAIQTQMDLKAPLANATMTGTTTVATLASTTSGIGTATGTSLATTGLIKSSGTAGIGYSTGAGGAQTQATDKSTTVVSNTITTAITMNNAALNLDTAVSFTFTNSTIAATDTVLVTHESAGTSGAYVCNAFPGAGSAVITVRNVSTGNLSEAIVLRVTVIKSVSS